MRVSGGLPVYQKSPAFEKEGNGSSPFSDTASENVSNALTPSKRSWTVGQTWNKRRHRSWWSELTDVRNKSCRSHAQISVRWIPRDYVNEQGQKWMPASNLPTAPEPRNILLTVICSPCSTGVRWTVGCWYLGPISIRRFTVLKRARAHKPVPQIFANWNFFYLVILEKWLRAHKNRSVGTITWDRIELSHGIRSSDMTWDHIQMEWNTVTTTIKIIITAKIIIFLHGEKNKTENKSFQEKSKINLQLLENISWALLLGEYPC